jgi:hypothetical protein
MKAFYLEHLQQLINNSFLIRWPSPTGWMETTAMDAGKKMIIIVRLTVLREIQTLLLFEERRSVFFVLTKKSY